MLQSMGNIRCSVLQLKGNGASGQSCGPESPLLYIAFVAPWTKHCPTGLTKYCLSWFCVLVYLLLVHILSRTIVCLQFCVQAAFNSPIPGCLKQRRRATLFLPSFDPILLPRVVWSTSFLTSWPRRSRTIRCSHIPKLQSHKMASSMSRAGPSPTPSTRPVGTLQICSGRRGTLIL